MIQHHGPIAADGYSASLERIVSNGNSNNPYNWAPSVLNLDAAIPSGTPGAVNSNTSRRIDTQGKHRLLPTS